MKTRLILITMLLTGLALPALCQDEAGSSTEEVARELSNPNTALASMTFKNQFRWFSGELPRSNEQWNYTLLFQPVLPFPRSNGSKIIFRPAVPLIVEQPTFQPESGDFKTKTGLGDIAFDLAYAFPSKGNLIMAGGLISSVPTAARDLGTQMWTLGPEFLLGKMTTQHLVAFFPNHQWNIAGWGSGDISLTSLQFIYVHLPGKAWNFGTAPIITYDWISEQWNVPLNLNVGKTVALGGRPWKLSLEVNYYVEKSDTFAAEWMVGLNLTPVMENYVDTMLRNLLK